MSKPDKNFYELKILEDLVQLFEKYADDTETTTKLKSIAWNLEIHLDHTKKGLLEFAESYDGSDNDSKETIINHLAELKKLEEKHQGM